MNSFIARDPQVRMMEAVVNQAEKHLGQLCSLLAAYTRRTAKLRDKADLLVRELGDLANAEDHELRTGLRILAEDLAVLQDYRQAQVERLETRVVNPLKVYGDIVKNKRAELKKFATDHGRDVKVLQKLDRIRMKNPSDRQTISQAEANALMATTNVNRSIRQLEETMSTFQLQKLQDIKRIFADFVTIEMLFHTKALEVYSGTFQILKDMDVDRDLEAFRTRIQVHDDVGDGHAMQASIPMASSGLSSLPRYPSPTPSSLRLPSDYAKRSLQQARQRRLARQEEVREGDEDEYDDEEDEEEEGEEEEEEELQEEGKMKESYAARYTRMKRQKS